MENAPPLNENPPKFRRKMRSEIRKVQTFEGGI